MEERVEGIYVTAEDLNRIGFIQFKDDESGCLVIRCESTTVNLEIMFLRSILKCYGDEYAIVELVDERMIDDYVTIKTNLPVDKIWEL